MTLRKKIILIVFWTSLLVFPISFGTSINKSGYIIELRSLEGYHSTYEVGCWISGTEHDYDIVYVERCNAWGCRNVPKRIPCQHPLYRCR